MLVKALVSFCGVVSMTGGEVKDITEKPIVDDLVKAGYVEKVKKEKKKVGGENG